VSVSVVDFGSAGFSRISGGTITGVEQNEHTMLVTPAGGISSGAPHLGQVNVSGIVLDSFTAAPIVLSPPP
jgi:hypothetical protein